MAQQTLADLVALANQHAETRRFGTREAGLAQVISEGIPNADTIITAQGDLIVGDASNLAVRLPKGSNGLPLVAGASTVSYAALGSSGIANDAVSLEHLDSGIEFSHRVIAAGTFTTAGGDANESITAAGALATDLAFVVLRTVGATPRTILTAVAATDAINVVFSGDPSTDHVVCWQLLRAAS